MEELAMAERADGLAEVQMRSASTMTAAVPNKNVENNLVRK